MSWLYTIFIAGMLFSSGTDQIPEPTVADAVRTVQTHDFTEKFEQSYPFNANGKVSLSNINGSIVIDAWDKNEVYLEATKIADSKESLDLVSIEVNARQDSIRIEAKYKPWDHWGQKEQYKHRKLEVQFRLMVPRNAYLGEINSVNGSIIASNFTNYSKISAVNGTVVINNLRGTVKASTVNGHLRAACDRPDARTMLYLDTVNGKVNLELPSDVNATLKAETMNGSITNDFGLPVRKGKYIGRDLFGRLGTGEVQVKMSAVNGTLAVWRKKDGKTASPVTNLLDTTKSEDDDPDDTSEVSEEESSPAVSARAGSQRTNKVVDKTHKQSQKEIAKIKMPDMKDVEVNVNMNSEAFKKVMEAGIAKAAELPKFPEVNWPTAGPTAIDQKIRSFDIKGTGKISIDAAGCSVRVRGWDKPTVKYVLTDARMNRETPLNVTENISESTVSLKVGHGSRNRSIGFYEGEDHDRLEVYLPRKSDLRVVSAREIRVEGIAGNLDITGEDESLSIRDSEGTLKLSNGDGMIRVVGFKGDLELQSNDAEVYLEGDFSKIDSCAVDSRITLTMPPDRNASISTNTAIESEGLNIFRENDRSWRLGNGGPKYNFEFADGRLVVRNQERIETN